MIGRKCGSKRGNCSKNSLYNYIKLLKSTVSDVTASGIDQKKGSVQNITSSVAATIRNLYDHKRKENVDVLTSQSLLL